MLAQQRGLVAAAGADLEHAAEAAAALARAGAFEQQLSMRATTEGLEIVWPSPIGRLVSS